MSAPVTPGFAQEVVQAATRAQSQAAHPRFCIFVEANAGSGKTRVLVDRVARLLLDGAPPDQLLCVTFTKAAAGEMQTRLFRKLGEWSTLGDEGLRAALDALGAPADSTERLAQARRLFAQALETPGGLKIQTLHSYCETLLRRFPLEAGLAPGFETQDDAEARALRGAVQARLMQNAEADQSGPVAQAIVDILETVGPTGLERIFSFAAANRHALTAARDEAGGDQALLDEASRVLGAPPKLRPEEVRREAWLAAPHSALRDAIGPLYEVGGTNNLRHGRTLQAALDQNSRPALAFDAYKDVFFTGSGSPRKRAITAAAAKAYPELEALFGKAGSETGRIIDEVMPALRRAEANQLSRAGLVLALGFISGYAEQLQAARRVDFDDLVERARTLLTDSAAGDWALYKLDRRLRHVLVDEAQDTAPRQWDIISALSEEFFSGAGAHGGESPRTVFCVGDEKQSIYSFQGARPQRFIEEGEQLQHRAEAAELAFASPALSVSFRSAPEILQAVDLAFSHLATSAPEVKFAGPEPSEAHAAIRPFQSFPGHAAARAATPGCVEMWDAIPRPQDEDVDTLELGPVDRERKDSARNQLAEAVAREISAILQRGDGVWSEEKPHWRLRAAEPGDIIVLVQRRTSLFDEIIRRLKLKGVPVAGADRMVLREQLVVQDLLSLARFALLPEDDLSLAEVLKSPAFHPVGQDMRIDDDALFDLTRTGPPRLWDKLRSSTDPRFSEALAALERARARVDLDAPYAFFAAFLGEPTDTGESRLTRVYARLGEEARDPLETLLSRALQHEREGAPSLTRFTAEISADDGQIKREMEGPRGQVRVMTVHAAKGLESPIVFLPDTTQKPRSRGGGLHLHREAGLLWTPDIATAPELITAMKTRSDAEAQAESQRLLYVAMTRARDRLIVCGHKHGHGEGRIDEDSWYARLTASWAGEGWTPIKTTAVSELAEEQGWGPASARRYGPAPISAERDLTAAGTEPALPAWLHTEAPPEPVAPRTLAPSRLLGEEEAGAEPATLSPLAAGGQKRFQRGAVIHKLLQTLPDLPPDRRRASAERFLAGQSDLSDAEQAEIAAETLRVLDEPAFAALFAPGSRAEASVAGSAPGLPEGVIVNGQIDRLVVTADDVLIVDYKTNRPPPEQIEAAPPAYIAQMAAYRALLQTLHPGKPVRCALLWTDAPRLMEIPPGLMDETLTRARSANADA
ncbi:MAG: double-strand break repair helicase AddA [Pseudomonadota bacterium]